MLVRQGTNDADGDGEQGGAHGRGYAAPVTADVMLPNCMGLNSVKKWC